MAKKFSTNILKIGKKYLKESYHAGSVNGGIVFGDKCFDQLIVTLVRHIVQRRPAGLRFTAKSSVKSWISSRV